MNWKKTRKALGEQTTIWPLLCRVIAGALLAIAPVAAKATNAIVIDSDRGGVTKIWRMNEDGAGLVQLTTGTSTDRSPVVSADGRQIAYTRWLGSNVEFHLMNADGSNDRTLATLDNPYAPAVASWHPDSLSLIVCYGVNCDIKAYRLPLDGGPMTLFLDPAVVGKQEVQRPVFSLDGKRIAWAAADGCVSPTYEIYTAMITNGVIDLSTIVQVTTNTNADIFPSFSLDGSQVAFTRAIGEGGYSSPEALIIKNSDGTGSETRIADALSVLRAHAWAPGGRILLDGAPVVGGGSNNVYVINPDGSGLKQLTFGAFTNSSAQWLPAEPLITTPPTTVSVAPGGSASFCVTVSGATPMSYQWRLNGTNIAGATHACYTIPSVGLADVGQYTVLVSNVAGVVTSTAASLTLVELKRFAGVVINGVIGMKHRIEFTPTLTNPEWTPLETVTLATSQYIYIDYDSPGIPMRFYRAVPLP